MAVNAIMEGVRPKNPEWAGLLGFGDKVWGTIELCWLEDRDARPRVEDILSSLKGAAPFWYTRGF